MSNTVKFYFDYVSPYSYLAQTQLPALAAKNQAKIEYVPMFLGALYQTVDNKSPAFVPSKAKYIYQDVHLWAHHYQLPMKWHPKFPFNTIPLLRATVWLQQQNPEKVSEFVDATFRAIWERSLDVTSPEAISQHYEQQGLEVEAIQSGIQQQDIKDHLKANTEHAAEIGLFGAPAFEINGRVLFGQDRLHFVEAALNNQLPEV